MRHLRPIVGLLSMLLTMPGLAAPAIPPDLSVHARLTIASVSPQGILKAENGEEVVLAGVRLPAGLEPADELQSSALRFLREHCIGREAAVLGNEAARDRWGRYLAHIRVGEAWIQARLVMAGLAVVESRAGRSAGLDALLAVEAEARRRNAGVWGAGFRVFRAGAPMPEGRFAVVEGGIRNVATVNGRTYFNFGANWRTDFTVVVDRAAVRRFEKTGMAPAALEGTKVRVRGMLEQWNGPLIRLQRPGQMEVLASFEPAEQQGQ